MQDLLNELPIEVLIGLTLLIVVVLVILVVVARRRRSSPISAPPPEEAGQASFGGSIDYTSLPIDDEPTDWRGRFARLSLPQRILAIAVPILLLLGGTALALALLPNTPPTALPPTPIPVTLKITKADLVRVDPLQTITINAQTTGMDANTQAVVELLADGQPVEWFRSADASTTVRANRIAIDLTKAEGAPALNCAAQLAIRLTIASQSQVVEEPLEIPAIYRDAFCGTVAQVPPTALPQPSNTAAPDQPTPTPEPTTPPVVALPEGPPAGVSNGGNVRKLPALADNVIGGVNVGESAQLLERTPNGLWYKVRTTRDEIGWVSASLLTIDATTTAAVPIATVVSVFGNGGLYEQPDLSSTQLERVNIDEVVELLEKTAAGDWYRVRNLRDITGWVPTSLLGIPEDVAAKVPLQGANPTPVAEAAAPAAPTAPTVASGALTAAVASGGNVRRDPVVAADNVVGGVNVSETVELLGRNADSSWYRVRTIRSEEGWVSAALLTIVPAIASQVPVI